jgi:hypothetical protein
MILNKDFVNKPKLYVEDGAERFGIGELMICSLPAITRGGFEVAGHSDVDFQAEVKLVEILLITANKVLTQ